MNRIMKFRAWREGYPGTAPPVMLYDEAPGDCLYFQKQGQPVHVMQFTGKKDKNGKEIYEADILRETEEGEFGDINHYYIVTWIAEWCIFAALSHEEYPGYVAKGAKALDETMFWTFNLEDTASYTVCANIYEHPDYIRKCMIEEDNSMDEML